MSRFKRCFKQILGFFPSKLPIGNKEFDSYCDEIFAVYDVPSLPSYRSAIASMIMHLPPTKPYKSKWFFVLCVRKAQANQVAYEKIQQIKELEKQAEDQKKVPSDEPISN